MTASYPQWLAAHGVNASLTSCPRFLHSSLHMIVIPQRGFPLSKMYVYDWSFFFKVSSGGILEGGEMEEIFFLKRGGGPDTLIYYTTLAVFNLRQQNGITSSCTEDERPGPVNIELQSEPRH